MSFSQRDYAIVDADDDRSGGQDLAFKTFDSTSSAGPQSRTAVPYNPFNIAYYQVYFDVDTQVVLKRILSAMIPRRDFVADSCDGQIDLYGPFWSLTTTVLILYTTSTLTASIAHYLTAPDARSPSNLPLLSTAATVVYSYGLIVPSLYWASTRWFGALGWSLAEALGIYGYGMAIFVPISLLCLVPVDVVRWILVGGGALSSGYFLYLNTFPVLAIADNKMARLLIIAVLALHTIVALCMKVLFFSYSVGGVASEPEPIRNI